MSKKSKFSEEEQLLLGNNFPTTRSRVKHMFNSIPDLGRKTVGLSLTVPSQTLSIRELVDRHVRGLPMPSLSVYDPLYEDHDTNGVNPKTLDLADIEQLKLHNAEEINKLAAQAKAEKEAAYKTRKEKEKLIQQAADKRVLDLFNSQNAK